MKAASGQVMCGCGHKVRDHDDDRCREVWRYPDVLTPRACGCKGPWQPAEDDSRYRAWKDLERRAYD